MLQVCQHIQAIGRPCGVWAAAVVGGLSPLKQARAASCSPRHCMLVNSRSVRGFVCQMLVFRNVLLLYDSYSVCCLLLPGHIHNKVLTFHTAFVGAAARQGARSRSCDARSPVGSHAERRR